MDIKKFILNILKIIFILIIILLAYQLLRTIFGGSWETENIIIAGVGIILTGLFVILGILLNQGKCIGMLEERTKNIGDSLQNLGNDFKKLQFFSKKNQKGAREK